MSWQDVAALATIAQAIVVIATLVFVGLQMRQQTHLARNANSQALVELSYPINLEILRDEKIAHLWVHGWREYSTYDDVKKYQFEVLLITILNLYANFYHQWRRGLLNKDLWLACERDIEDFLRTQHLELFWDKIKDSFDQEFKERVSLMIRRAMAEHPS
jgi:hypothetical protein